MDQETGRTSPALAIKQAGHSKDFTRRTYPGTYSLATIVPVINLWPEAIATGDVLAYADRHGATDLEREEYRILYPAYGSSMGGVVGDAVAGAFLPIYAGTVVAGHIVGRWEARQVSDDRASNGEPFETALSGAIERLPAVAEAEAVPDSIDQCVRMQITDESLLAAIAN